MKTEKKYQIELYRHELEIIRSALKSEKEVIYAGSSAAQHKTYHWQIDEIINKIKNQKQ